MTGKAMRLKRVIDPEGVSVICALDHGMTSPTFLEPLSDIRARTVEAVAGGANVIMMSKGMIRVACVGDSITYGAGIEKGTENVGPLGTFRAEPLFAPAPVVSRVIRLHGSDHPQLAKA